MAIKLKLNDNISASAINDRIKALINESTIQTWLVDEDGDYTLSNSQSRNQAWFKSYIQQGGNDSWDMAFGIIGRRDMGMSCAIYGIYHGRFAEILLTYFDKEIKELQITPQKDDLDLF